MGKAVIRDKLLRAPVPMMNPRLDEEEPEFCYFRNPTDVLGWIDSREAAQVTPTGCVYTTNAGELVLFGDHPPIELEKRVKTLHRGYLPIVEYRCVQGDFRYAVQTFARPLGGDFKRPLVVYVEVKVRNLGESKKYGYLSTGFRFKPPADNQWGIGDNHMSNYIGSIPREHSFNYYDDVFFERFDPEWRFYFVGNSVLRNTDLLYEFNSDSMIEQTETLFPMIQGYKPWSTRYEMLPTTPAAISMFGKALEPREEFTVRLKIPVTPMPQGTKERDAFHETVYEEELKATIDFWEEQIAKQCRISIPEPKVENTFKANFIFNCIAREKIGRNYVQKVNRFQYNAFWLRDASFMARAYDLLGRHDLAEDVIRHFLNWQGEDGLFLSQGGQYDGWGQTLWAFGAHYLLTRDDAFAKKVFPSVVRAMQWIKSIRQRDIYRLVPETTPGDNEAITGHITGHNFWAVIGMRNAIVLAEALGEKEKAREYRLELEDYKKALMECLSHVLNETGNYIPPGLDEYDGEDWGNLLVTFLSEFLPATHPAVVKTMNVARSKFREGLMTYFHGLFLHHYITFRVSHTTLLQGNQLKALEDFYNVLVHTSSTHTGFETRMTPWSNREFGFNMAPHGWFGAEYIAFVRAILMREENNDLHLLSALSPAWIGAGKNLAVDQAPTNFGSISFHLDCTSDSEAQLVVEPDFHHAPGAVFVHLPNFMEIQNITVDGHSETFSLDKGMIRLSPERHVLTFHWKKDSKVSEISYLHAVNRFKKEWKRRFDHWQETGETLPDDEYVLFPEIQESVYTNV